MDTRERVRHILKNYEPHELEDAFTGAFEDDQREIATLRQEIAQLGSKVDEAAAIIRKSLDILPQSNKAE